MKSACFPAGDHSLAPGNDVPLGAQDPITAQGHAALAAVPPSTSNCKEHAAANTGALVGKGEADKRCEDQVRFTRSQESVEGVKQVVAYVTPVADGMKALMFRLGLTVADAVYVATYVNAHNEWEIFSGMTSSAKEYYVTECLKERKGWRYKVEDFGNVKSVAVTPPSQMPTPVQPLHSGLRILSGGASGVRQLQGWSYETQNQM